MGNFLAFLWAALFVGAVQNLVLVGGYGASEAFRMAAKPKWLAIQSAFISLFSVLLAVIAGLLDRLSCVATLSPYLHFLVYVGILLVLYFLICAAVLLLKADKRLISRLGVGALNSLVLAVPLINRYSGFSLFEAAGTGLGAGVAFCFSVLLISAGLEKLRENDEIPLAFRGSPALFIYTALIALGLAALSGRALTL